MKPLQLLAALTSSLHARHLGIESMTAAVAPLDVLAERTVTMTDGARFRIVVTALPLETKED